MIRLSGLAALLLVAPVAAAAQTADPAGAPVQALNDGLLAIMKGGKAAGVSGRSAKIAPVVDRAFDIPLMTRLSVGPAWTTTAPGDQSALVAAIRKLTIAQYASNFDGWSGESFKIAPQVETRGTDKLVRTTLVAPKGDSTAIAYRLRQSGGQWKIIDVFYQNSVSQLATRRSDFAGVLAKGGAKALVTHLDQLSAKAAN
ncbi:ABC transporter substrate-binding protein [Sphingomonas sp. H39-1-10]|uniref:ABC transporter substrate-binding protein n=1 Tax=Sphingomonas TaxID=13687 RepID=UPI00088EEADC|nr:MULTISPECIES: ABC transporter substrate-binding protein [Sphingomonas]MDF0487293.1 ABC transporter substrate-binding protein [Sphingomonas pollutisoli]SDA15279.1 phospholipid transport system substrate-binding protein [Sphingomonas sp. NFR15]